MRFFILACVCGTFLASSGFAKEPTRKVNVIVILADDQGWGDLGVHGNTNLKTPHLDSIAKDGAIFDRFFVQPVCSPTRAEFLTGRYHPRGGVWNVSTGGERLNLSEKTIADSFKAAGYATAAFGKWHNGTQYPYHPNGRGFDEYYGFTSGHWGDYFAAPLDHNGKDVVGKGFLIDDLTDHVLQFIEGKREKPFFCYLALNTPHSPMQVPDAYWDRFKSAELKLRYPGPQKENLDHTRAALAMCENIDHNVGRILAKLRDAKLADDTLVVYFSDNGPNGWRWNGGMKGRKGTTDEGGVRSPLMMRLPSKITAGTKVASIAGAVDLLPTLLELTGVKRVGEKPLDGVSQVPALTEKTEKIADRMLFAHWAGKTSVRTQQYRLDADGKLFDMVRDPRQERDIASENPQATNKLQKAITDWRTDVGVGPRKDDRPFPVGYREFPRTQLPARDGVPHGGIRRSAQAPNCSFFTNWTAKDDRITWDIEIATEGEYRVEVMYTCSKENVGSRIEIILGDAKLSAKVSESHDPPLRGKENDRVVRQGESYVKDFKGMEMGTITLPKGRGLLTLRAIDIAGKEVMDVREVRLTRK